MTTVRAYASLAYELAMSLVAPPSCAACDAAIKLATVFCGVCARTLERAPLHAAHAGIAPFVYGGALATAIHRLKYEKRPDLARPLASLLAMGLAARANGGAPAAFDLVVPVPLHPTRLAERGFNQAALLAAPIARRLDARFRPTALARVRETASQATLAKAARHANVERAFVARRPRTIEGLRVLLIDDVRTTGATLDACARALRDAGAVYVETTTLATAELDAP